MTIALDIKLTKLLVPLADITGTVEVDLVAEALTGSVVRDRILEALREKGFTGTVVVDGDRFDL